MKKRLTPLESRALLGAVLKLQMAGELEAVAELLALARNPGKLRKVLGHPQAPQPPAVKIKSLADWWNLQKE